MLPRPSLLFAAALGGLPLLAALPAQAADAARSRRPEIGHERAILRHLLDGEEYTMPLAKLLRHGEELFVANWTLQDGAGRPLQKGNGAPLSDPSNPLVFPRAFNRISANDANSCASCHSLPFGVPGGGGDFAAGVFVTAQRFDFATLDHADGVPTRGTVQENGLPATLQSIGNYRASIGMYGAGYIELLAREMTAELQAIRNRLQPGQSAKLLAKGIHFGVLSRDDDGTWDTSAVTGLPAPSLATRGPLQPPDLLIRPFHQSGAVVSLRQFSNNAYHHHHGMQSTERFGQDTDPDGDGVTNELTRADITAVTAFQATLPVPGRRIPRDPFVEAAIRRGEQLFTAIGCAVCHIPELPLESSLFVEPSPYQPAGNLQPGMAPPWMVDLGDSRLPSPRLSADDGLLKVPAFTDLKLHDICLGPNDPNIEPIDMSQPAGSPGFFGGNRMFLTKKLWGCANEPPYFHHGQYTTLREAVLGHDGEAAASKRAFAALTEHEKNCVIECLKSLQILPPGTRSLVVDEHGRPRTWKASF